MIELAGQNGRTAGGECAERLRAALRPLLGPDFRKAAGRGLAGAVKAHLASRFPGSRHWSPQKVAEGPSAAYVDIAGAGRAYHEVTITPKTRKYLAVPFSGARGGKPSDFKGLFPVKKRNGSFFLALKRGEGIQAVFALVKRAFQPRDPGIMPSDRTLADSVFKEALKQVS